MNNYYKSQLQQRIGNKVAMLIAFLSLFVSIQSFGQNTKYTKEDYGKTEVYVKMRDGVKLHTTIYQPLTKSKANKEKLPVLICRTPYSCAPYGKDEMKKRIFYNPDMVAAGYIFVYQDVRGRWMSEGEFENTKPPYSFSDKKKTDEVTDSYDTFEWLSKNLKNYNGNIGIVGNSYLGWTSLVAGVCGHPDLKASMPMAPVTNFFFEDFNRYGLLGLNYLPILDAFGIQKTKPTTESWYDIAGKKFNIDSEKHLTEDYYQFFLDRLALKNMEDIIDPNNFFWKNIKGHPNYDDYRQKRNWIQYLNKTTCQTLVVGGLNDEQNLFGIINSFKELNKNSPKANVKFHFGPWTHGHHKKRDSLYYLGNVFYGYNLSKNFQQNVQLPYFEYHLKGQGKPLDFKAKVFDTGKKTWKIFQEYPFAENQTKTYYLRENESMQSDIGASQKGISYVSNPRKPVPFIEGDDFKVMAPKHYFTDDQRFAGKRPDVLTFSTDVLKEDLTVLGAIKAYLNFSTDHTDADLYVKIIDVYPKDRSPEKTDLPNVKMNGYQQMVRCGYIRGRYRSDYTNPAPLVAGEKTMIEVPLLELSHTFQKGHKIMIQVQSSMFPLFDVNPQKYVKSIYEAEVSDFESAIHTIYFDSKIVLPVVEN